MVQKLKWECVLCGYVAPESEAPPAVCPDCSCPKFREINDMWPEDHPTPEAIAHLVKKVELCPNYLNDPKIGSKKYHKLVLQQTINYSQAKISSDPKQCSVTIQQRCEGCNILYGQRNVPLSRPDVLEKLGILEEVEKHVGKLVAPTPP